MGQSTPKSLSSGYHGSTNLFYQDLLQGETFKTSEPHFSTLKLRIYLVDTNPGPTQSATATWTSYLPTHCIDRHTMTSIVETVAATAKAGSPTTAMVVKNVVSAGWLPRNHLVIMAAGIFPSNHKTAKNNNKNNINSSKTTKDCVSPKIMTRPFRFWKMDSQHQPIGHVKNKQEVDTTISSSSSTTTIHRSWGGNVTKIIVGVLLACYVVYPTSLLLLFRVSEQFASIHLFQLYHSCRTGRGVSTCFHFGMIQAAQFVFGMGSLSFLFRIWKGRMGFAKSIGWSFFAGSVIVAIFKIYVDHVALYYPPSATTSLLNGTVAVVTGANRGIGLETAMWLAKHGVHVVVTCRSLAKCQPIVDNINAQIKEAQHIQGGRSSKTNNGGSPGSASAAVLDLSSLQSAIDLAVQLDNDYPNGIHYLFCNAGTTPQYPLTKEGLEDGFGGMHLAHMAVVMGVLPLLKKGADHRQKDSRIVMVSSEMSINAAMGVLGSVDDMFDDTNVRGERMRGDGTLAASMPAYGRAKLCNVLFAMEVNRRMKELDWPIIANAVHTGAVVTDSSRNSIQKAFEGVFLGLPWLVGNIYFPLLWRGVGGGARTLLCAALSEKDFVVQGGQYLDALCHAFLPTATTSRNYTPENIISIPLGEKTWNIYLDPVQALLIADSMHSKWLWNISMSLLEASPANGIVERGPFSTKLYSEVDDAVTV